MPHTLQDPRHDPFSFSDQSLATGVHPGRQEHVLYHPGVGMLKLGVSDFDLWKGYKPGAEPQPCFQASAGLHATFLLDEARSSQMMESAFASLETEQAIRIAKRMDQPSQQTDGEGDDAQNA